MRTITIKTAAITHNLAQVKKLAPTAKVLAMVKANAYGHGVAAVLPALKQAKPQADGIGVATLIEALMRRVEAMLHPVAFDTAGIVFRIAIGEAVRQDKIDDFILRQTIAEGLRRKRRDSSRSQSRREEQSAHHNSPEEQFWRI